MTVQLYTDTAHDYTKLIAACGYCVLYGNRLQSHEVAIVDNINNTQEGEAYAAALGLWKCYEIQGVKTIVLYTDCQVVFNTINGNISKKSWFVNSMACKTLLDTIEAYKEAGIILVPKKVKAHLSFSANDYNRKVDNSVRNALRNYSKQ